MQPWQFTQPTHPMQPEHPTLADPAEDPGAGHDRRRCAATPALLDDCRRCPRRRRCRRSPRCPRPRRCRRLRRCPRRPALPTTAALPRPRRRRSPAAGSRRRACAVLRRRGHAGRLASRPREVAPARHPHPARAGRAGLRRRLRCSAPASRWPRRRSTCTWRRARSCATSSARGRRAARSGHVFAGQYGGYLWPMGPFFAARPRPRPARLGRRAAVDRARRSRSARGGWCACSTRSPGARAAPATWPAACSTCSTRTSSPTWGARRSRCWLRGAAVAAAVRAPRTARSARAGGGRRRSRSC